MPAALLPDLSPSLAPDFGAVSVLENTAVVVELRSRDAEGQPCVNRVTSFPKNGTLYRVDASGQRGPPVALMSSRNSETFVSQWVYRVPYMTTEFFDGSEWLRKKNITEDDVHTGRVPQVCARFLLLILLSAPS